MKKTEISIIVPVYNTERNINHCIDSILAQTFTDFELLIIDDGSTDKSGNICYEYYEKDTRIRIFHQRNKGVSCARNLGIENASGEYVIFVDSDDWLEIDALNILMNKKKADLVFYGSTFHYSSNNQVLYSPKPCIYNGSQEIQEGIIDLINNSKYPDYLGFTWNKLFKLKLLQEYNIRFVKKLSCREDEVFTFSYAYHCKNIITLPDIIYNYRVSDTGLTRMENTKKEFYLLSNAYMSCWEFYSNKIIKEYLVTSTIKYSLFAIKRTRDIKKRNRMIKELWTFCNCNNFSGLALKIKPIYLYLLKFHSADFMKKYMFIKLLFKL